MSKYLSNQRRPWISLTLLLTGYAIQGYLLTQAHQPLLTYLSIVVGYILIQAIIFHPWTQQTRNTVKRWVSSDAIHVAEILIFVFLISLVMSSLELFEELLLVLAVEILARLDLYQKGFNQMQKVAILSLCLILGLALGWAAGQLITR